MPGVVRDPAKRSPQLARDVAMVVSGMLVVAGFWALASAADRDEALQNDAALGPSPALVIEVKGATAEADPFPESPGAQSTEPLSADFVVTYERDHLSATSCSVVRTLFEPALDDPSVGNATAWLWVFPDGSISEQRNPVVDGSVWGRVTLTIRRPNPAASPNSRLNAATSRTESASIELDLPRPQIC